jgi:large subunit ribosomal protein L10
MKTREQKQKDLEVLAQQFQRATAAMVIGFNKLTVAKDQELRNSLREAGATYSVVKNTLARRAAEGTPFAQAAEHFKGVTAVAVASDPVTLAKAVSRFTKENPDVFTFKAGVVEGRVVAIGDVDELASLPPKEDLISKVMFLINAQAQRLATVISAVPRNLAVVVGQISENQGGGEAAS